MERSKVRQSPFVRDVPRKSLLTKWTQDLENLRIDIEYRTIFDQTMELWHCDGSHVIPDNPYISQKQMRSRKRQSTHERAPVARGSISLRNAVSSCFNAVTTIDSSAAMQTASTTPSEQVARERLPIRRTARRGGAAGLGRKVRFDKRVDVNQGSAVRSMHTPSSAHLAMQASKVLDHIDHA